MLHDMDSGLIRCHIHWDPRKDSCFLAEHTRNCDAAAFGNFFTYLHEFPPFPLCINQGL